ncbi:Patatin-like phospholipase domain-containing protein 3 [Heterocephalus glaber]|uniref:Patatin-like phospholipase domain-containing protein 3 n=1 Tax=Heterocephalus glaber TaxID=10181 RepID=G5BKH0_HETGA|nr:Patatin-like phospholipase domain-containing protein 3 [Heterocephalus glaber]
MDLVRKATARRMGTLHPSFNLSKWLRDGLQEILPDNVHQLVSGRICISLTRVSDGENVLVSDFRSKEEVLDALLCSTFIPFFCGIIPPTFRGVALMCSTFIPFFCGIIPPTFRGVRYMDGGMSNNLPILDVKTTITVSPFYGECDICPKVKSTNFFHVNITNLPFRLCLGNLQLLSKTFFPSNVKVMGEICLRGYLDALRFLEENGIYSGPQPCLKFQEEEPEPEVTEPLGEGPALGLAEGEELLKHLRLSILPWDEHILDVLSPVLRAALNKAIKDRGGFLSKVGNLLPVRILSFVMLPCTLPVESAVATIHRLVMWLPHIPDDVQWLQWVISQFYARVTTCLLPSARSQMPGSGQHALPRTPEGGSAGL